MYLYVYVVLIRPWTTGPACPAYLKSGGALLYDLGGLPERVRRLLLSFGRDHLGMKYLGFSLAQVFAVSKR